MKLDALLCKTIHDSQPSPSEKYTNLSSNTSQYSVLNIFSPKPFCWLVFCAVCYASDNDGYLSLRTVRCHTNKDPCLRPAQSWTSSVPLQSPEMLIPATMRSFSFSFILTPMFSPCLSSLFSSLFKYCLRMTMACLENSFDNFQPQKAIAGNITALTAWVLLTQEVSPGRRVKINSQIFSQLLIKISALIFLFMTRSSVRSERELLINNI